MFFTGSEADVKQNNMRTVQPHPKLCGSFTQWSGDSPCLLPLTVPRSESRSPYAGVPEPLLAACTQIDLCVSVVSAF